MEATLPDVPCLYFAVADTGELLDVNSRLCRELGYQREELVGQKLEIIYTVSSRIFYQTHFFPLLKLQGGAQEIYLTLQTKENQALPVLINAERTLHAEGATTRYAGIVVRNRKKFEEELVAARKAAEAAAYENTELIEAKKTLQRHAEELDRQMQTAQRQNEELKLFNRVVTHNLQEPLRKLLMFTNLQLESDNEERRSNAAGRIASAASQMRSVVNGLQQYVWLTDTEPTPIAVDLNQVVKTATEKIAGEIPDVVLTVEADDLPSLLADIEQIHFLIEEVLCNAVRFRKPGPHIKVTVSASRLLQNQFKTVPGKYKYVDYFKLEIADNGSGMNAQYKNQALELFKRLHANSGRGVGLSLCQKIVANHGGSMVIDSKEGKGTTVTVWLPVLNEPIGAAEAKAKNTQVFKS